MKLESDMDTYPSTSKSASPTPLLSTMLMNSNVAFVVFITYTATRNMAIDVRLTRDVLSERLPQFWNWIRERTRLGTHSNLSPAFVTWLQSITDIVL